MVVGLHRSRTAALWALLLVVVVLAASASPAIGARPAKTRDISQVYVAGAGGVDGVDDCEAHMGGACFPLLGDELEAAIGVVDDSGRQPTSATYRFVDDAGAALVEGRFCETTTVAVPAGAARLDVFVAAFDIVACDAPTVGTTGKIHVRYKLSEGDLTPIDIEPQECLQPVPGAISLAGLTEPEDLGQAVTLDTYVLLDGISVSRGRELMEKAAAAFEPIGIDLRPQFHPTSLPPGNGQLMLSHTKNAVGGEVPPGFDIVHTLTDEQMNVHGQADCVGGVRYRDRALSVSTDIADRPITYIGPVKGGMLTDYAAKIAAHEIGHTMGAHHHDGNCVEPSIDGEPGCTVMHPTVFPMQMQFSSLNGGIVRAHAVRYASP